MKKLKRLGALFISAVFLLSGCAVKSENVTSVLPIPSGEKTMEQQAETTNYRYDYQVVPETFQIIMEYKDKQLMVSGAQQEKEVSNFTQTNTQTSWIYPEEKIKVLIEKQPSYLDVSIENLSDEETSFSWPYVKADNYALPLGEGKWIPSDDTLWMEFLNEKTYNMIESYSMSFFSSGHNDQALVYILPDNWDNDLIFSSQDKMLEFKLTHEFLPISNTNDYHVRIYPTDNNPTQIAKTYKTFVEETQGIKTLIEKEKENPNIAKLYGAPHIYLFDNSIVSDEDIAWNEFRKQLNSPPMQWIKELGVKRLENGSEWQQLISQIETQDYVDLYQTNVITQMLSQLLRLEEFYSSDVFVKSNDTIKNLLTKENRNEVDTILLNKHVLYENMPNVFVPVEKWANDRSIDIIAALQQAGIKSAWLGIDNWEQAYGKPELASAANEAGYLIGPYDSYHSIHPFNQEQWHTAAFRDFPEAFEELTIQDKNYEYITGFKGVGRKINPTVSMPLVKTRLDQILGNEVRFNSWFVDCDATGEIFNDYKHNTNKKQDYDARLQRMEAIAVDYQMVVGSEGGNDYAVNSIAFAHGIELPTFAWMDSDMSKNSESEYYLGRYYAPNGGVPEKMSKQVPIKEKFRSLFLNPVYNIPLYKLVYNNAVITSYHWDWNTLKIKDEVENRMLYEMLYNVPSMYMLDKFQVKENIETITAHNKVWSEWSKTIIHAEMTDFQLLSVDRLVQTASYEDQKIIVNFSDKTIEIENEVLPAYSALLLTENEAIVYTPNIY